MGDSCSKMEDPNYAGDPEKGKRDQHLQKQRPHSFVEVQPTMVDLPPLPATPPSALSSSRKRKSRFNLFRVNSRREPNSPTRASNYNHVHEAVDYNFQRVATLQQQQKQMNSKFRRKTLTFQGRNDQAEHGDSSHSNLPLGVVGLRNLGNTCFLNSSLQCLSATIPLTDYFLGYDYRSEINQHNVLGTGGKLATAYAELMKELWLQAAPVSGYTKISARVVKPTRFKSSLESFAPQFLGTSQHDAQELLSFLLDGIHEDLNRIPKKPYIEDRDCDGTHDERDAIEAWKNYLRRDKSLVVDIFQGQLRNTLTCLTCRHVNVRFEPFMYLSLPLNDDSHTLDDCLRLYLAEERLVRENQWYCSVCQTHRDATKKTDLWIVPAILIVHLKRFRFNEYGQLGSKNNARIRYPVGDSWDLSGMVCSRGSEEPLYDLYAVSNHVGDLGGGHYTAYSLNRFDDHWYEFNDTTCRKIDDRTLQGNSSSAYLLFYNRTQRVEPTSPASENSTAPSHCSTRNGTHKPSISPLRRRVPLIRRQSVSRPDLWPHTQVQNHEFREFARQSFPPSQLLDTTPETGDEYEEETSGGLSKGTTNTTVTNTDNDTHSGGEDDDVAMDETFETRK